MACHRLYYNPINLRHAAGEQLLSDLCCAAINDLGVLNRGDVDVLRRFTERAIEDLFHRAEAV